VLVGSVVAGPAWIWVLPLALAGQSLLLTVHAELSAEFPISGGAHHWTRRLAGSAYGWFAGWVAICACAAANSARAEALSGGSIGAALLAALGEPAFAAVVLMAFLWCGIAAQRLTAARCTRSLATTSCPAPPSCAA
jgi:amino acid transporter